VSGRDQRDRLRPALRLIPGTPDLVSAPEPVPPCEAGAEVQLLIFAVDGTVLAEAYVADMTPLGEDAWEMRAVISGPRSTFALAPLPPPVPAERSTGPRLCPPPERGQLPGPQHADRATGRTGTRRTADPIRFHTQKGRILMTARKNTRTTTRTARSRTTTGSRARTAAPTQPSPRAGRRPVVTVDLPPIEQIADATSTDITDTVEAVAAELVEVQEAVHAHVRLALADLVDHPHNPRSELKELESLSDSIRRSGIEKEFLVVPLPNGSYMIIDGHRRKYAGLAAGATHTDCVVRADLATPDGSTSAEQIAAMMETAGNQEGLSRLERARGYAQMVAFPGMTAAKVARRFGIETEEVKQAVAANKLDPAVQKVLYSRDLTLDDALALAEFEDDPKLHAKVLDKLAKGSGSYVIAEERYRRVLNAAKKAAKAELAEAGCAIVTDPGWHFPRQSLAQPISNLRDKRGRTIGQAKHAKCSGHAAFLRTTSSYSSKMPVEVVYVCTDPEGHGHTLKDDHPGRKSVIEKAEQAALTPEQIAEREAADDEARLAWATAAETRREWLGRLVRAKSLNPVLARRALGAARPNWQTATLAAALLSGKPEIEDYRKAQAICEKLADDAPVSGLHRHTVGYFVADQEHGALRLDVVDRSPYGGHRVEQVAAWLELLVELGHQPTEAEQQVIERGAALAAEHQSEEEDDVEEDVDDEVEEEEASDEHATDGIELADPQDGDGSGEPEHAEVVEDAA